MCASALFSPVLFYPLTVDVTRAGCIVYRRVGFRCVGDWRQCFHDGLPGLLGVFLGAAGVA